MSMMSGLPGGCNPADVLFKLAHGRGITAPVFLQVSEQGPPHDKTFNCSCTFLEGQYQSVGQGRSKKEARNASAKNLITQLDLSTLPQVKLGKRKASSQREGGDNGGQVGQPGKKKNKGMVAYPPPPMQSGGPTTPLFGAGSGFGNSFQTSFGCPDFMGQGMGGMHDMGMGMGGESGFGMGPMNPMMGMGPMNPMMGMGGYHGGMGNFQPRLTPADKQVMDRHQEVFPADEELDIILMLVDTIEKALKRISDKFIEESGGGDREIMGVARVGDLAKGLLLTGDKEVNLVVMCSSKPSLALLETITTALKKELGELEESESKSKHVVHMFPEEGGLCVTSSEMGEAEVPYQVTVTLTSTLLRKQETVEEEVVESKGVDKDEDIKLEIKVDVNQSALLPRDKGILALAELRHSKWFSAIATNLSSCVESIRILRDKVQRDPAWSSLGNWAIELLVERALFSAGRNLSPSSALMRIMEVVASGLLMPDGQGIQDPCEREDTSVFSHMTLQMREDVTKQAQEDLRNIHFRKIHLVIGSEKWDPVNKSGKEKSAKAATELKDAISGVVEEAATV